MLHYLVQPYDILDQSQKKAKFQRSIVINLYFGSNVAFLSCPDAAIGNCQIWKNP